MSIYEKEVSGNTVNFREIDGSTLGNYVLRLVGESGTLTDEQYTKLVNGFPNVLITLNDVYTLKPERVINGQYYFQMVEVDEDENGKFVGDINVIVNADKTWQYGEFYIDVPQGGVPQYNLSTVLRPEDEVTLDMTDTMALYSLMSNMNDLVKFQNIGVVIEAEEGSGHQPFIGLDIKADYVGNVLVFSYQGLMYNVDIIADLNAQVIKGKVMVKTEDVGSKVTTVEISQTGASGYLDVDAVYLIADKFPNVNIRVLGKFIYTALEFDATTNTYKFANVNTSDTQVETKLITVNANTNEWTSTQYLADLGGGGLTWKQVTYNELKTYMNSDNIGKIVMVQPKSSVSSTYPYNLMSPILLPIGYFYDENDKVTVIGIRYHVSSTLGVNSNYNNRFQLVENIACFTSEGNKGYKVVRSELLYSSSEDKYVYASKSTSIFLFEFFDETKMDLYIQE